MSCPCAVIAAEGQLPGRMTGSGDEGHAPVLHGTWFEKLRPGGETANPESCWRDVDTAKTNVSVVSAVFIPVKRIDHLSPVAATKRRPHFDDAA